MAEKQQRKPKQRQRQKRESNLHDAFAMFGQRYFENGDDIIDRHTRSRNRSLNLGKLPKQLKQEQKQRNDPIIYRKFDKQLIDRKSDDRQYPPITVEAIAKIFFRRSYITFEQYELLSSKMPITSKLGNVICKLTAPSYASSRIYPLYALETDIGVCKISGGEKHDILDYPIVNVGDRKYIALCSNTGVTRYVLGMIAIIDIENANTQFVRFYGVYDAICVRLGSFFKTEGGFVVEPNIERIVEDNVTEIWHDGRNHTGRYFNFAHVFADTLEDMASKHMNVGIAAAYDKQLNRSLLARLVKAKVPRVFAQIIIKYLARRVPEMFTDV